MSSFAKISRVLTPIAAALSMAFTLPAAHARAGAGPQSGYNRTTSQSGYNKNKTQTDNQPSGSQSTVVGKDGVLKLNSTVVSIKAVVTERSGRYVPQLTKDDFELDEDGVRQQIAFFGNEEVPFNVALLMDLSQSVSSSLKDIKKAATAFVNQLRPNDRVMIVAFDQQVMYLTDFTNDRKRLESAIKDLHTGHGTSVYEAVYNTVASRFRGFEGRKAMLLLSDGEDTTSRQVSYDQTINRVAESDVPVYGLRYPDTGSYGGHGGWGRRGNGPFRGRRWPFTSMSSDERTGKSVPWTGGAPDGDPAGTSGSTNLEPSRLMIGPSGQWGGGQRGGQRGPYGRHRRDDGRDFMKDVAEASAGPVYDAKSIGDLSKLAVQIADELRHVYVLGYYPARALSEGGYRSVQLKVKGRDDVAVRHRRGYDASQTAAVQAAS